MIEAAGPTNEPLRRAMERLYADALGSLARYKAVPFRMRRHTIAEIRSRGQGHLQWATTTDVDWAWLALEALASIRDSPSFAVAEACLRSDPVISAQFGKSCRVGWVYFTLSPESCIEEFLIVALERQRTLDPVLESRDCVIIEFERFFHADTVPLRALCPLHGFDMQQDELVLGDGLRIIRLDAGWIERILTLSLRFQSGFGEMIRGSDEFAVEYCWEDPKGISDEYRAGDVLGDPTDEVLAVTAGVVVALRLFRPGAVSFTHKIVEPLVWTPSRGIAPVSGMDHFVPVGPACRLETEDTDEFWRFWVDTAGGSFPRRGRIGTAIARFTAAYERIRPEDRLVDLMIALEALLLNDHDQGELGYRLALRGSALLATTADKREEVFQRLRSTYSARSGIVHGGEPLSIVRKFSKSKDVSRLLKNRAG